MRKKIFLPLALVIGGVIVVTTTLVANYFIMAWTEPTSLPPGGDVVTNVRVPKFITPALVFSGIMQNSYLTFNASSLIPAGTEVVLLEVECGISVPDNDAINDVDAHIRIRKNSASQSYLLLRGRASGASDNVAQASQGVFPVESDGTFQYIVESPGFSKGCKMDLIGYY